MERKLQKDMKLKEFCLVKEIVQPIHVLLRKTHERGKLER